MNNTNRQKLISEIYGLNQDFLEENKIQKRHLYEMENFNNLLTLYDENLEKGMDNKEAFTDALRSILPVVKEKAENEKEDSTENLELLFSDNKENMNKIEAALLAAGSIAGCIGIVYGLVKENKVITFIGSTCSIICSIIYFINRKCGKYKEFFEA